MTAAESDLSPVGTLELAVAEYGEEQSAMKAFGDLCDAGTQQKPVVAAIVVTRSDSGKLHVVATTAHSAGPHAGWGAVAGALTGVLDKMRDTHHDRDLAAFMGEAIDPGQSAVLALVDITHISSTVKVLSSALRVTRTRVDDRIARDIRESVALAQPQDPTEAAGVAGEP